MSRYDVLRDTWIYQEIQQEVRQEEQQQRVAEHRQMLMQIVQVRFPRVEDTAKRVAETITDPKVLRDLIVKMGTVRTEKEARQGLMEVGGGE